MSTATWLTFTCGYFAVNDAIALSNTLYRSPVRSQMVISPDGGLVALVVGSALLPVVVPGAQAARPPATSAAPAPRKRLRRETRVVMVWSFMTLWCLQRCKLCPRR